MHPIYFAFSGPDRYHWMYDVTSHQTRHAAMLAVAKRPLGWVGAVTSLHQTEKWGPTTLACEHATDYATGQSVERYIVARAASLAQAAAPASDA